MKNLLFLFAWLCLAVLGKPLAAQTGFVTLYGEVTITDDSIPMPGYPIDITDGMVAYTTITDSIGNYSITVPTNPIINLPYIVSIFDACTGILLDFSVVAITDSVELDINMCGGINPPPSPTCDAFFTYASNFSNPLETIFTDLSFTSQPITSWSWDFGDGNTDNVQNPVHTYDTAGTYTVTMTISTDSCTSTDTQFVYVQDSIPGFPICEAFFIHYPVGNLDVQFQDLSWNLFGLIDSIEWDFGDGNTLSNDPYPIHTYAAPGDYTVTLNIWSGGCSDSYQMVVPVQVIVLPDCEAWFSYDYFGGLDIQFYDASNSQNAPINTWSWDFGDGNTASTQNPNHSYTQPGIYPVTLTITTDSCTSTYVEDVVIDTMQFGFCDAYFYEMPVDSLTIQFTDISFAFFAPIDSWLWDFGDGTTDTVQNPLHTFPDTGIYVVTLTITSGSCSSTISMDVLVGNIINPTPLCFADFGYFQNAGLEVQFQDYSYSSNGPITSWFWDFGDGNTSVLQNPVHTYAAPGFYPVLLTITTDSCSATVFYDVHVFDDGNSCIALFYEAPVDSLTYTFFDISDIFGFTITEWLWDFGDGTTDTVQNPTHTFPDTGVYTVALTITTLDSCTSTTAIDIIIGGGSNPPTNGCSAYFSYSNNPISPATVDFFDLSIGNILSWTWDFGDGNGGVGPNPTHVYGTDGIYLVTLTINTADSCTSTFTDHVIVFGSVQNPPACQAVFSFDQDTADLMTFHFTDLSSGDDLSYLWDFGDGSTDTLQNPSHTYAQAGIHLVHLTVSNDSCSSSTSMLIFIDPYVIYPNGCFALFSPLIDTASSTVFFLNFSSQDAVSYLWDFGDGNTSTEAFPIHTYATADIYTVTLTITTSSGCVGSYQATVDMINGNFTGNSTIAAIIAADEEVETPVLGQVKVYPNPASNFATLQVSELDQGFYNLTLVNINGQVLMDQQVEVPGKIRMDIPLEIADLPAGTYFIMLTGSTGVYHQSLIKQ